MLAADLDIRRLMGVRAIEGGLLRLKWLAAATRFELALHRHMRALKYSPDQPRVPRGNPDGGEWTDDDGGVQARPSAGTRGKPVTDAATGVLHLMRRRIR